ncbi:MAG: winged helix-turn-helix domain-containing protein [Candidatus Odinarchaeota archaeon]
MVAHVRPLRHLIGWLIAGTRGGITRGLIILELKEMPLNANQLATSLELDYHTIRHHLKLLNENGMIVSIGESYGVTYMLSPHLEANYEIFEEIWEKTRKRDKKEKSK